jgi:uncharacterized protein (DUF58 family)
MSVRAARPFPLIPRRRFAGVQIGTRRSPRRGSGDEVAGTRPYRPGDRRAWIDWRASAKVSAARQSDEFVVREFFAEQAPRVVVIADRSAQMGLYGDAFPWLDKGAALETALELIALSTTAERGELAYVAFAGEDAVWLPPRSPAATLPVIEARGGSWAAQAPLERCFTVLARHGALFPHGTFVFVLSDFLRPPSARAWVRLRGRGWDVTPIVIQDPVWEQSFPAVGGVLLPLRDASGEAGGDVWVGHREARARARDNEQRLAALLAGFGRLGFDPLVLDSADPNDIAGAFRTWAQRRRRLHRGRA